jgi:hypothetical protein
VPCVCEQYACNYKSGDVSDSRIVLMKLIHVGSSHTSSVWLIEILS